MADYMVVASGASSRQVAAMAEHLEFKLKQNKVAVLGLEGLRQADWVLIDANDVIVHSGLKCMNFMGLNGCGPIMRPKKSSLSAPTGGPCQNCLTLKMPNMQLYYRR